MTFSKATRSKTDVKKSIIFLYIGNKWKLTRNTIYNSFFKTIIYLGMSLKKKNVCKTCMKTHTLLRKIKDLNKGKKILCSWIGTLNIVKIWVSSESCWSHAILIIMPESFLIEMYKLITYIYVYIYMEK